MTKYIYWISVLLCVYCPWVLSLPIVYFLIFNYIYKADIVSCKNCTATVSTCTSAKMYLLSQTGYLPNIYHRSKRLKTLMTLIQHSQMRAHVHNTPALSQSLFPSVSLHYVTERVVCGSMDPSNLISHCGRTAYIRKEGESRGWREREELKMADGLRMKWSLENSERWIYRGLSDREGEMKKYRWKEGAAGWVVSERVVVPQWLLQESY